MGQPLRRRTPGHRKPQQLPFAFFLIDPKGWRIPLEQLRPMLSRSRSEVVFNFMFEFINRAASVTEAVTINGLNELMPGSNWQKRLRDAEKEWAASSLIGDDRNASQFPCRIIAKETRHEAVGRLMKSNGDNYWDHPYRR